MQLRLLSAADLRTVLDMPTAVDVVARAFARLSEGRARAPLRTALEVAGGVTLVMPGVVEGGAEAPGSGRTTSSASGLRKGGLGAKLVSVFPGNPARGLPSVSALVVLVDPGTGVPRAILEGSWLTALRTGAASGAATRFLARDDAEVLAVFGAGVQARSQISAVRAVRSIREIRVVSRSGASAGELVRELRDVSARAVDDPREALAGADVVVAATNSSTPVFPGEAVEPGTHVNGVGSFTPEMREVDGAMVARATVVVDDLEAAWAEAGDLVGPLREGLIRKDHVRTELGEVVRGIRPGRTARDEITFFKSVGNAVQDMSVAAEALRRAEDAGIGTLVEL